MSLCYFTDPWVPLWDRTQFYSSLDPRSHTQGRAGHHYALNAVKWRVLKILGRQAEFKMLLKCVVVTASLLEATAQRPAWPPEAKKREPSTR